LRGVRFKYKKAQYIVDARRQFLNYGKIKIKSKINQFADACEAREWLAENVKGIGYKEASHFLRNIGMGQNLAILDRHILKNMKTCDIIKKMPTSLSKKEYLTTEQKLKKFTEEIKIPISHLDLLWWSKETGEIFK
jgi:N-glycosylase/DNA lyase